MVILVSGFTFVLFDLFIRRTLLTCHSLEYFSCWPVVERIRQKSKKPELFDLSDT